MERPEGSSYPSSSHDDLGAGPTPFPPSRSVSASPDVATGFKYLLSSSVPDEEGIPQLAKECKHVLSMFHSNPVSLLERVGLAWALEPETDAHYVLLYIATGSLWGLYTFLQSESIQEGLPDKKNISTDDKDKKSVDAIKSENYPYSLWERTVISCGCSFIGATAGVTFYGIKRGLNVNTNYDHPRWTMMGAAAVGTGLLMGTTLMMLELVDRLRRNNRE